jgi:Domain of unknown function (DUF5655)
MNWICPDCRREFTRKNQIHNCAVFTLEEQHLQHASPAIASLYHQFIAIFSEWGPLIAEPLKNLIALKKRTQFGAIWIQKKALKIHLRMYSEISSLRFHKVSKNGKLYWYDLYLRGSEEMDSDFKSWVHMAYSEN